MKKRVSSEGPALAAESPQHPPQLTPRRSFDDRAEAEHQSLSAAITPAIESMLQVAIPALCFHFWTFLLSPVVKFCQ